MECYKDHTIGSPLSIISDHKDNNNDVEIITSCGTNTDWNNSDNYCGLSMNVSSKLLIRRISKLALTKR